MTYIPSTVTVNTRPLNLSFPYAESTYVCFSMHIFKTIAFSLKRKKLLYIDIFLQTKLSDENLSPCKLFSDTNTICCAFFIPEYSLNSPVS